MSGEREEQVKQKRQIIVSEDSVRWEGFENIYEVLGFIDLHMNPPHLKETIVAAQREPHENKKE